MQQVTIATMRAQWNALDLKFLTQAPLTDADFGAALAGRENPADPAFLEHIPITVARFKDEAEDEIMQAARIFSKTGNAPSFTKTYLADTKAMNDVLFSTAPNETEVLLGRFTSTRAAELHADGNGGPHPVYLARLGALPAWYIRHKDEMHADPEIRVLIDQAMLTEGEKITARTETAGNSYSVAA